MIKEAEVRAYFELLNAYFKDAETYPKHQVIKFHCPWPRYFIKSQELIQIAQTWWSFCDSTTLAHFRDVEGLNGPEDLAEQIKQALPGGVCGCIYRFMPGIKTVDDVYEKPFIQPYVVPAGEEFGPWFKTTKEMEMGTRLCGTRLDPFIYTNPKTDDIESALLDDSNYIIRYEVISLTTFASDMSKWLKLEKEKKEED